MNEKRLILAATHSWKSTVERAETWFDALQRADFELAVAPGRNRVLYLYGHLIGVHDLMYELLGLGARKYDALDRFFLRVADRSLEAYPDPAVLNEYWHELHPRIAEGIAAFTAEQWASKHAAVSEEDFEKSPWRNRFSVLLSRTNHLATHFGQLRLVRTSHGR